MIAVHEHCPQTPFISVGDRETDVYELFMAPRPRGVDLLVRAAWDRRVEHPERYLWASVTAQPVAGTLTLEVPRRGAQPARVTTLTARFGRVSLRPPRHRQAEHLPTVEVFAVQVLEEHPPAGIEPLEWLLLTTWAITPFAEALERVQAYAARWGIEILHKVLKSGCRIEARQLESADRLHRCLAIYSVIAWRILYATMLSRTVPDMPCTALLEPEEWQALYCAIRSTPTLPPTPPTLRQAVHWIARLGASWTAGAMGNPASPYCGRAFSISPI